MTPSEIAKEFFSEQTDKRAKWAVIASMIIVFFLFLVPVTLKLVAWVLTRPIWMGLIAASAGYIALFWYKTKKPI